MSEEIRQVKNETNEGVTTRTTHSITDDNVDTAAPRPTRTSGSATAARVIWFIAGVLLVLLAFRFVLVLLGANPTNGFANFIYTTSHPFVAPFFSLFNYNLRYGVSRLEIFTLVAMAVYAVIAFGLARLVTLGSGADRPAAA